MSKPKTKAPAARQCKCIEKVNKLLKPSGWELMLSFIFAVPKQGQRSRNTIVAQPVIETSRIVGVHTRTKRKLLIPQFCPFCGKEYPRALKVEKKG